MFTRTTNRERASQFSKSCLASADVCGLILSAAEDYAVFELTQKKSLNIDIILKVIAADSP